MSERAERPWGGYEVLCEEAGLKVKRFVVLPGRRLSLQLHHRRSEHWYVVAGTALVTVDGRDTSVYEGGSVDVPLGVRHRVANPGATPLVIIEVQAGDYTGEDDIERLEDDFGRL